MTLFAIRTPVSRVISEHSNHYANRKCMFNTVFNILVLSVDNRELNSLNKMGLPQARRNNEISYLSH